MRKYMKVNICSISHFNTNILLMKCVIKNNLRDKILNEEAKWFRDNLHVL